MKNWKSLNLSISLPQERAKISAKNGAGKTSIQSAWNWLLCGYTNPYAPKNHELFDNKQPLTHETPIASVKVWLDVDGIEYTLEKTAQAKFSRRRGSNEWEKDSSDVYKTYIDEIETSATDFTKWVEHNLCEMPMLPFCLDGAFFTSIADDDKKKARKILEAIVGEITDKDFSGDYSVLSGYFAKGYSIEQIEEMLKNQIKPVKKSQTSIPIEIEQKEALLAGLSSTDYTAIENKIAEKRKTIEDIDKAILGAAESIEPILGKRDATYALISSKTLELNEHRNAYLNEFKAEISQINTQINALKNERLALQSEINIKKNNLESSVQVKDTFDKMREELVKKRNEIKSNVFDGDKCSYCGQDLPFDMVEESRSKFNLNKETNLNKIIEEGKELRAKIDKLAETIKEQEESIKADEKRLEEMLDTAELVSKKKEIEKNFVPFEETEEYKNLKSELDELNNSIPEIPSNDTQELTDAKKCILDEIEELNKELGKKSLADSIREELKELHESYRNIGNRLAELEGIMFKCKEYNEERANIISGRINNKLEGCQIVMWETQKNGEMVPSCVIVDENGVKFSTLNNSKRIKVSIAIQRMFCKHFGIDMPVFIDEASVFDSKSLPVFDGVQSIYLYASDDETIKIDEMKDGIQG